MERLLVLFSTPYYIFIILAEIIMSNARKLHLYSVKDTLSNLYLMILNALLDVGFRFFYAGVVFAWAFAHRVFEIKNPWLYWLILLVSEDFLFYWLHRFDHNIRFFWATHVTHHSSEKFNFSVGFRSSVFQPLYRFIYFLPLPFLGFQPMDVVFIFSATQIWGIFVHTELIQHMGFLEKFMVTPSHHRVHHGSNPAYLDKNMGMFLIIWDKIFGTFQAEIPAVQYQPIRYGLTTNLKHINPVNLVFHEWIAIFSDATNPGLSLAQRLKYIFGPPGWSHDGHSKTSEQLRKEESMANNHK